MDRSTALAHTQPSLPLVDTAVLTSLAPRLTPAQEMAVPCPSAQDFPCRIWSSSSSTQQESSLQVVSSPKAAVVKAASSVTARVSLSWLVMHLLLRTLPRAMLSAE